MRAASNTSWHKASSKWCAYANIMGKRTHIGLFATEQEAIDAAQKFKELNDIETDSTAPLAKRVFYSNGQLLWCQHGRGHTKNGIVGSVDKKSGYRFVKDGRKKIYVHRLVWETNVGEIPDGMDIDHINGIRDDNRIENLRTVTRSINLKNKRKLPENKTGYRGVLRLKGGQFLARVWSDGRQIKLGVFSTAAEAGEARIKAERNYGYHENHGGKSP